MAVCRRCATDNNLGQQYCVTCGSALESACSACEALLAPGQRFCGACGTPVALTVAAPSTDGAAAGASPASSARRTRRTVLFVDLTDAGALSRDRDPADVRLVLSEYLGTARTVVQRYGGHVEQFVGQAVVASWGAVETRDGDPERAVRAAIDIVNAVADLGDEMDIPDLTARAGLITAEAGVESTSGGQPHVDDEAIATAARIGTAVDGGGVVVDAATRRLADAAVEFDDLGAYQLKGRPEPEQLWRALRVVSGVGGSQRVEALEAPLAGRDVEFG